VDSAYLEVPGTRGFAIGQRSALCNYASFFSGTAAAVFSSLFSGSRILFRFASSSFSPRAFALEASGAGCFSSAQGQFRSPALRCSFLATIFGPELFLY